MKSIRTYQKEIRKLKQVIGDMHWVQPTYNGSSSCAYCGAQQHMRCYLDCEAAAITGDYGGDDDKT